MEYNESQEATDMTIDYSIKVTQCEPMPGYKLKVTCSDGATGIFDMSRYVDIDIAAERVRSDMQIISEPARPRPDRHQDGRGFFMSACMTDMTRRRPRVFSPGLFISRAPSVQTHRRSRDGRLA